jgi:hypothetical protein
MERSYLSTHKYRRSKKRADSSKAGIKLLDKLCEKIETEMDAKISSVYCNRFQNPEQCIDWHKDTFGEHIFVLTLVYDPAAERIIELRAKKTQQVQDALTPRSGDLYFVPLKVNDAHQHRVCCGQVDQIGVSTVLETRLSMRNFQSPPKSIVSPHEIESKDLQRICQAGSRVQDTYRSTRY